MHPSPSLLSAWLQDSRRRTLELVADLSDEQLLGPRLAVVNPPLWEIGHLAWFQERWALRRDGRSSILPSADELYDSSAVAHARRWSLPLPGRADTFRYMQAVLDRVLDEVSRPGTDPYYLLLALFHEDMHGEAFAYTRQTLAYPAPRLSEAAPPPAESGPCDGDVRVPGDPAFRLGAEPGAGFVFDNEKWAHEVAVAPFAVARAPVTQAQFAAFVEDGGYRRPELWDEAGRVWLQREQVKGPAYWRSDGPGRWLRRDFDRWLPLEPHRPVLHVSWYEADAYCRWARRRLPTEAEWELAAAGPGPKRLFPWGDEPPAPAHANLDGRALGTVDVVAHPAGDSGFGCRQMIGNVWEWTSSDFLPYPGFVVDPYQDYSRPWFGNHKVLRGGCWATRGRLLRTTWRNFYRPERRDVWSGFRTCALP